jgi:hypothetical protein
MVADRYQRKASFAGFQPVAVSMKSTAPIDREIGAAAQKNSIFTPLKTTFWHVQNSYLILKPLATKSISSRWVKEY